MSNIPRDKLPEQDIIYVATNGRRRWGICPTIHTGGFFVFECGTNWSVIRREHFDTIQKAMGSAQRAENVPLLWNEVQSLVFSPSDDL
jgi:hypothetical protein